MKIKHMIILTMFYTIVFFFSSRRRHTRLTCDWSSDVCSSDLCLSYARAVVLGPQEYRCAVWRRDRKSVVEGKSVDLGGRRIIKKKKKHMSSGKYTVRSYSAGIRQERAATRYY